MHRRTRGVSIALICAVLISACYLRPPEVAVDQLADGRISIHVGVTDGVTVQSIAIHEVSDGLRGDVVWALARDYQARPDYLYRREFMYREVPLGYLELAPAGGELVPGEEYIVAADGGAFHGETRFVRDDVTAQ